MRRYKVETLVEGTVKYYFIRDCETLDIVYFPSKYLKYKIKSHRSPNTVKRAALAICYYLEYLILSRLVDTFISRISLTMLPVPNPHNTVCVLS